VVAGLLVLTFVVARGCQQSQVRVSEEQAIASAKDQVTFEARRTQIRLLRQGINSKPYWIVSLSVPGRQDNTFSKLAVVRVNANSGEVEDVKQRGR
jgi:hypothetical protein